MEFVLIIICSIIAARYLEKKMKIASIAYSILFIFSSIFYIFGSDFKLFALAGKNILGANHYEIIHDALHQGIIFANFSLSAIFIIDTLIFGITIIVSTILFIKGLKKLFKKIKISTNNLNISYQNSFEVFKPVVVTSYSSQYDYLVLGQLRN